MPSPIPLRPRATLWITSALWALFYASFTLLRPALLDDADSVHAEVAREMLERHDYVTLYANGIRYLEKAPLLYWSMAGCMRVAQALGYHSGTALAVAARVPLAFTVLALALLCEAFARRAFRSTQAGLYAALVLLSSPGIFLFTRILLPDAMVCLWLALAMYTVWRAEECNGERRATARWCWVFAVACALNVLTKGLIGVVFPVAIAILYLLLARGLRGAARAARGLPVVSSCLVFLLIAAPWHVLIAVANPTQGHPGGLGFQWHRAAGEAHWSVPLPTDGNVHGWLWFYFVNEQVLRYLNLRVPRDYDTVPLWLFWGLCAVWVMPWSAFALQAVRGFVPLHLQRWRRVLRERRLPLRRRAWLLLVIWGAFVLFFFLFSTRQEYYVMPALPACAILVGGWLSSGARLSERPGLSIARAYGRAALTGMAAWLLLGIVFAAGTGVVLSRSHAAGSGTDLASLLQQNPQDYAMSMGHFLDLNTQALGLFRLPLAIAALSLLGGPLAAWVLLRRWRAHGATLALASGAFGFLLAAHLGLQRFAPVLSSEQLAQAIRAQTSAESSDLPPLIVIHQEYEYGSTLGFYLQQPQYTFAAATNGKRVPVPVNPIRILTEPQYQGTREYGRSSNLWYGSFFPDAPRIFETKQSLAQQWGGRRRIFVWQDLANQPAPAPELPGPVYVVARSGGKEILSNQPNRP